MRRRIPRRGRGQAVVEYSILTWLLMVALVLSVSVKMFPTPGLTCPPPGTCQLPRTNVIEMMLNAFQEHYNSMYFVINLPFP